MFQFEEVQVPRASGPTIARWQLGHQLKAMREAAKITQLQIADVLGCSESKIYKIEAGDVGINRGDLLVMLDRYKVADESQREAALDLQKQGKQRGCPPTTPCTSDSKAQPWRSETSSWP